MIRKALIVAAAIAMPFSTVAIVGSALPAGAKTPNGTGSVLCVVSGTVSFNPALTPGQGTPGYKDEIVTISLSGSGCSGPSSNTPLPNPTTAAIATKPAKIKATKVGKVKYAGGCNNFATGAGSLTVKSVIGWSGGAAEKGSKTTLGNVTASTDAAGNVGFTASGSGSKSYAGSDSAGVYFTTASSNAIVTCVGGSGPPISSLNLDPTYSTITVG